MLGRTLTVNEMYCMNAARNVFDAKREQMQQENRADWAEKNRAKNDMLTLVEKLLTDEGR